MDYKLSTSILAKTPSCQYNQFLYSLESEVWNYFQELLVLVAKTFKLTIITKAIVLSSLLCDLEEITL